MPRPKTKDAANVTKLELDYTVNVRKVLYITEFVILLNYVEVIVPIIFTANLIVNYHLPNRVFYSQIANMDGEKLRQTIGNVMLYCFLQIVSLVVLFYVLWHNFDFQDSVNWRLCLRSKGNKCRRSSCSGFSTMCKPLYNIVIVKDRVNAEHIRQILASSVLGQMPELRRSNILGYAEEILERHCSQQIAEINTASPRIEGPSSTEVLPFNAVLQPNKEMLRKLGKSPSVVLGPMASESVSAHKVFPSPGADVNITDLELQYALNVRKVLYITEFVILINYVEVIVPIIFSANLIVMYHLPNRVYYSQIDSMSDEKLRQTIGNVMLYCFLQLVSLVILFFVIWRRLQISGLRQLAFVLEKQAEQVQTKLVLWVFYNVQATLQHFGKHCYYSIVCLF
ncbi:hypothetical protein PR001_g18171 [Phytophthora rubi]|uniref:Uncharacterized protein n=1 Tax=Phytophthora rubi TaxID=129364 RepID=A0A6A3KFN0_9STRA|nr:hypothetical protein PR001_g18171 [Phytophthora rubi]